MFSIGPHCPELPTHLNCMMALFFSGRHLHNKQPSLLKRDWSVCYHVTCICTSLCWSDNFMYISVVIFKKTWDMLCLDTFRVNLAFYTSIGCIIIRDIVFNLCAICINFTSHQAVTIVRDWYVYCAGRVSQFSGYVVRIASQISSFATCRLLCFWVEDNWITLN